MRAELNSPAQPSSNVRTTGRENHRSAVRYALRAEVVLTWTSPDGVAERCRGWTRDISPGGAYVFSPAVPPRGCPVQLRIYLPMLPGEAQLPCVEVRGNVLRVDKANTAIEPGFAVRNEKVTLCAR